MYMYFGKFLICLIVSNSYTDFIQDNTINSVYGDSLGSENDTPAKAKRGLNKILSVGRSTDDLLTTNMINMNIFVLKEVVQLE